MRFCQTFGRVLLLACMSTSAHAGTFAQDLGDWVTAMKSTYQTVYAPAEWKKQNFGYDLNAEYTKAESRIQASTDLSVQDSRQILMDFVYATHDYHTAILFTSTETASLPFQVVGVGTRYFFVYIDRTMLPEGSFPFEIGDELVTFGGQPTDVAVKAIQNQNIANVPATDWGLACLYLTHRTGREGQVVPQGPIEIGVQKKGDNQISKMQLIWDYTPEMISPRDTFDLLRPEAGPPPSMFHPVMKTSRLLDSPATNPYSIGGRQTFTPDLGSKIWESDSSNQFYAYIYQTPSRKLVGYVRIPSYEAGDYTKAVKDFADIITRFQANTDSMIIDEVNNPGGSVFYLYTLASMLTDRPLYTPLHHMTISQSDVADAVTLAQQMRDVKTDADAQKAISATDMDGYPVSYELAKFQLNYAQFIISEWTAGHHLSQPYWIGGVDHINPASTHYTKPILVLTNHLDFSGADFFPTIMQDNQRATIMGARTAGAGGYIEEITLQNDVGVSLFSVTGSIAVRLDGNPIENLGVTPDIGYDMTVQDYTQNYAPYQQAIQKAVDSITPQ